MMAFGHAGGIIIALVFAATILVYIDPTKVVRAALQGAASVAGLLTTEAMVAELPKKQSLAMLGGGLLTVQTGNQISNLFRSAFRSVMTKNPAADEVLRRHRDNTTDLGHDHCKATPTACAR
jgi:hypothetical protein